jgi:hypothetical protein
VFPGGALQRPAAPSFQPPQIEAEIEAAELIETAPSGLVLPQAPVEDQPQQTDADLDIDSEPMPTVDPTAELLGTAKRKRTGRSRPATPVAAGTAKKPAAARARKSAPKRAPRGRKTSDAS